MQRKYKRQSRRVRLRKGQTKRGRKRVDSKEVISHDQTRTIYTAAALSFFFCSSAFFIKYNCFFVNFPPPAPAPAAVSTSPSFFKAISSFGTATFTAPFELPSTSSFGLTTEEGALVFFPPFFPPFEATGKAGCSSSSTSTTSSSPSSASIVS